MVSPDIIEKVGDYRIREQSFEEIQSSTEIPFTICGVNPYGYYQNVRRFVADLDDTIVGDSWTMTSRYNPWGKLAHFGMFSEEHKRKGLGGRLLKLSTEAVRQAEMEAMFIDTGPSIAHLVYEKYGFRDVLPNHPEWLGMAFNGQTIQEYHAAWFEIGQEPLEVRPLDFSHLIEIQVLLNASADPNILVKNYLMTLFADDQVHEGQIMVELVKLSEPRPQERKIRMMGLFSGPKLIGFSTIAPWRTTQWDNGHEFHIGLMDIYLYPPLWRLDRCKFFFEQLVHIAKEEMGLSRLRAMETPRQNVKTAILSDLGFKLKFEMPDQIMLGEGDPERGTYQACRFENLAVYEIALEDPKVFTHPYRIPWDY